MTKTLSVQTRIILDPRVQAALAPAKAAQAEYERTLAGLEKLLNPDHYAHAARIALDRATTTEAIEAATREMEALTGPGGAAARARAQGLANTALHAFEKTLPPLLEAAAEVVKDLKAEAIESEKVLFEIYAMAHEPTAVSRRVADAASKIEAFKESLKPQMLGSRSAVPGAYSNLIQFFL